MDDFIILNGNDNVAVALRPMRAGRTAAGLSIKDDVPRYHKFALCDIPCGGGVIKYGHCIGTASRNIYRGEWVHTFNLVSAVGKAGNQVCVDLFKPEFAESFDDDIAFTGYVRGDGRVGIRNEIWIIPTVGCVNELCRRLAGRFSGRQVYAFTHDAGCSQCGRDEKNTQKLLSALAKHPNAGGVLIVSLGCENNNLREFSRILGKTDGRVRFLVAQEESDEFAAGVKLIEELIEFKKSFKQGQFTLDRLTIGLKCGGSDSMSGITANPLVGRVTDIICGCGGSAIMGEVPEMFGAEQTLLEKCRDKATADEFCAMIKEFKEYFDFYGAPYGENPSPGNKEGGITTIEEKSLGCVKKAGVSPVVCVAGYGESISERGGVTLIRTPGNDIAAVSALAAAGAQLILFTTGRGTPLGSPVPVIKISSNTELTVKKPGWIDFDAQTACSVGDAGANDLLKLVLSVASGSLTASEKNGCRDFAVWRNGITL